MRGEKNGGLIMKRVGELNHPASLDRVRADSYIRQDFERYVGNVRKNVMEDYIIKIFKESGQVKEVFVNENLNRIVAVVGAVTAALKAGNKILLFGNGGSAADAQHLAAEFVNRFIIERPPLPAIALTTDTSIITSIGNDYDFAEIFSKQIRAIGRKGDIAWGMTTSGTSVNVVKGLEAAKKIGMVTVGLTGRDGGDVAKIVDHALNVSSTSTPRIQEVHITVGHVICEMVDFKLFQRPDMK
jgi:D-sedoheptulose 7-phosphate isomerase